MTITAAADGSALGNPGPAGWAWFIDEETWRAGGWPHGTNNMGELKAVLDLLEATAEARTEHLLILCDSQYVINSVTKWMPGWKRKGWRKKDGKPVLNVELLKAIDAALVGRSVEFEWVKGHAGHVLNEAADRRANAAATAYQRGQDPQVGPGFRTGSGTAAPASAPAPTPAPTPAPAPRPRPAADEDLFSLLEEPDTAPAAVPGTDAAADSPFEDIVAREQALLSDLLRANPAEARRLLHPSFTEIGASGRTYGLDGILDALAPLPSGLVAEELVADEIAPGVVLLNFTTSAPGRTAVRRSSVWVRTEGQWLLRHHQGTPERGA